MGALDQQIGFVDESTYGTAVTVTKFYEFNTESIKESEGRTEGTPLRVNQFHKRTDRFTPYFAGASGSIQVDVLTKGFGFLLKHMLGTVATTGPAETVVYSHTATELDLITKSFTCQVTRPFHPSGTVQAFTYSGGKVTEWTLSNSVDGNLVADLNVDFQQVSTAVATATASYPTGMENLSWAGGVVSIAGSNYDVTEISIGCSNGLNTDRRQIRANTLKKEPTGGQREGTFSIQADFDSLTQRNRAHAAVRADATAQIIATWNGPTLLGSTIYPQLVVTIPTIRFDEWEAANSGPEGITQTLSGVWRSDTASAATIVYKSADVTA